MSPIYVDGVEYSPESILRLTTAERLALSPAVGKIVFDTDTLLTYSWDGAAWNEHEGGGGGGALEVPDVLDGSADAHTKFKAIVDQYLVENANITPQIGEITLNVPANQVSPAQASVGGCLMPLMDAIMPGAWKWCEDGGTNWNWSYYIDTNRTAYQLWPDNLSVFLGNGAVYHPLTKRAYFVPAQTSTCYYFVDYKDLAQTNSGNPPDPLALNDTTTQVTNISSVALPGLTGAANRYSGAAWHNGVNRIYFGPANAGANWHYINGAGNAVAYTGGTITGGGVNAYWGAVYHPITDELYFIPFNMSNQPTWHKIDSSGNLATYPNPGVTTVDAFYSGTYDPYNERIWMTPFDGGTTDDFWFIDNTGTWQSYTPNHRPTDNTDAYCGGAYAPTVNKIFWCPYSEARNSPWIGIDCSTQQTFSYTPDVTYVQYASRGAVYSPREDVVHFMPYNMFGSGAGRSVSAAIHVKLSGKPRHINMGANAAFFGKGL